MKRREKEKERRDYRGVARERVLAEAGLNF